MFFADLKQIVPSSACLKCEICCRYPQANTAYVPYFFPEEIAALGLEKTEFAAVGKRPDFKPLPVARRNCFILSRPKNRAFQGADNKWPLKYSASDTSGFSPRSFICRFFAPEKNRCRIYARRPLDCRLYPFMVTYARNFQSVVLALDSHCPYGQTRLKTEELKRYVDYLAGILDNPEMAQRLNEHKNFINAFQEDSLVVRELAHLTRLVCRPNLGLRRLSLTDKGRFDAYFRESAAMLSAFSFNALYVWSTLLNILWKKIGEAICIFAGQDKAYFLFLQSADEKALAEARRILERLNEGNRPAARIENVPAEWTGRLRQAGLSVKAAPPEYLYSRRELAELSGNRFKAKRALVNHFCKHYRFTKRPFCSDDAGACLELYRQWAHQKWQQSTDDYFRILLEDSYFAQKTALFQAQALALEGLVVEIAGVIKGYSLGFALNKEVLVNLFETVDLKQRGLAQFIFREFAAAAVDYRYINTLSDSGLANLRRVKESYHPLKRVPVFTAYLES